MMKLAYRFANTVGLRLLQVIQNATLNENLHHLLVPDARNAYPVEKGIIIGFFDNFSRKCLTTVLPNLILPLCAGGNISRKNKKPYKKMKKTLFTLALCAASLIGTASADGNAFTVTQTDYDVLVTGTGTLAELNQALTLFNPDYQHGDIPYLRLGDKNGQAARVKISKDDQYTPTVGMLEFANAILEFEDVVTLKPDKTLLDYGPGMLAGYMDESGILPGSLTISISKSKVDEWLDSQGNLDVMASWHLLDDAAEIRPTAGADVKIQFIGEDGQVVVPQDGIYEYQDGDQKTHEYKNVGVVWNAGALLKNQIALHFVPGAESAWGGGQLNVLALGEEYKQVPEPATGTLSLLALAGLAARRRRK